MNLQIQTPTWLVGSNGKPVAIMVDIATWQSILERLEDQEDIALLQAIQPDLERLAAGESPDGWLAWDAFEEELDALESTGALPA